MTEEEAIDIAHAELRRREVKPKMPLEAFFFRRRPRPGRPPEPGWLVHCDFSHNSHTMDPNSAALYVYESDRTAYLQQLM